MNSTQVENQKQIEENLKNTLKEFQNKNLKTHSFCVMPFVNITLEPTGEIGICRHKGTEFTFGSLRDKSLEEIWSSPKLQEWRKELIEDNPNICKSELIDQRCNLCSELNKLLPYAEINNIQNPKILRLTANFNGKCNLECPMCDVWQLPNGFYTEENFWKPARSILFPHIKEIDMLSGEPFIQKDTYKLIDEVSELNPECLWSITTNVQWTLTPTVKSKLDKIKIKNLIVSIDSLEDLTYAQIRKLGKLDTALKNLDNLLDYQNERIANGLTSLNIRLNCTTQKANWKEIENIVNFCYQKKIIPFISFLYNPEEFSILNLNYQERIQILDHFFENFDTNTILHSQRVLKPIIRSLEPIDYANYLLKLKMALHQ